MRGLPRRVWWMGCTWALSGVCVLGAPAMDGQPANAAPAGKAAPVAGGNQQLTAGPLWVELSLDRASISVAQSVTATLRVVASRGVRVELPGGMEAGGKLGEWTVAQVSDEPARAVSGNAEKGGAGGTEYVRRVTLEPFLSGEYSLPELEIGWRNAENGSAGAARTAPMRVSVTSLLPAAKAGALPDWSSMDPGTIRDEYVPREASSRVVWLSVVGVGLGLVGLTGVVWAAKRRKGAGDPVESAFERVSGVSPTTGSAEQVRGALDVFAGAIRTGLADRVLREGASASPDELARLSAGLSGARAECTLAGAKILGRLDEIRFSGGCVTDGEFASIRGESVELVAKLRSMERVMGRLSAGEGT